MRIEPYARVDDTPFSATSQQIEALRGPPLRRLRNAVGLNELDYGDVVFRFQDCGRLEEVSRLSPVVFLGGETILFPALAAFVRRTDPDLFERGGFLVSPRHGIAFDPACPSWVTALAAHCIDTWRAL